MCGIFCIISKDSHRNRAREDKLIVSDLVVQRGPDAFDVKEYSMNDHLLIFGASVLWLQGQSVSLQPIENDKSIFLYNGDIFGGMTETARNEKGDTLLLHELLESNNNVADTLRNLQGPYAFIYFVKKENTIYFGRDIYGRRSLLIGVNNINGNIILSSTARRSQHYTFMELPSIGTFAWNLRTKRLKLYAWEFKNQNFDTKLKKLCTFLDISVDVDQFLQQEIKQFVGPSREDLIIFDQIKHIECNSAFDQIIKTPSWLKHIMMLKELLEEAVRLRISLMPQQCSDCFSKSEKCNHALIGVLFSGGIDCSLLALLADKFVHSSRPIDLINVSFDETNNFRSPDRLTGISTLKDLQELCPKRTWQFYEVNVTKAELDVQRRKCIADLIYPLNSILDDSLGCALWFASRGKTDLGTSSCKVLLVGMGADELFGGYTKHRAALKRNSWRGLHNILDEDWQNLSHRNLARDDRVVSDHGRQLRTPYLDENVVEFVRHLHCWEKTCPSDDLSQGFGEKILLRCLAYYMGLKNVSTFKKRALQFGSRIANKKENANDISTRLCL